MKKWSVVAACAVIASVVLYFTVFRASDESRIRDVVNRFAKACEVRQNENPIIRAGRLNSAFKEIVDDDVRADVEEIGMGVTGRKTLAEDAAKAAAVYSEASIDLSDVKIKIDDSKTTAKVDCVATLKTPEKSDKRDVHFLLRNDGGWKISSLQVVSPKGN